MSLLLFEGEEANNVPQSFVTNWTTLLNKGSLLTGISSSLFNFYYLFIYLFILFIVLGASSQIPLRETFAQNCFELLLQLSFMEEENSSQEGQFCIIDTILALAIGKLLNQRTLIGTFSINFHYKLLLTIP